MAMAEEEEAPPPSFARAEEEEAPPPSYAVAEEEAPPPSFAQPEGALDTFARHAVHAIPAAIAGGIAGSAVPGLGTIGGILVGGGTALAAGYGERKLTEALAPEEAERLRAGEEAHPW